MSRATATPDDDSSPDVSAGPPATASPVRARLPASRRRDALLDAATRLVLTGGADAVTVEAVADEAGVSRPLVYKHFPNRHVLLAELRRRESAALHEELRAEVLAAPTAVEMFRTLVRLSLRASEERGALFLALRQVREVAPELAAEQRRRDRATLATFTDRVVQDHGVDPERARAAVAMLLAGIDVVLARSRRDRRPENAQLLEQTYLTLVTAALQALSEG